MLSRPRAFDLEQPVVAHERVGRAAYAQIVVKAEPDHLQIDVVQDLVVAEGVGFELGSASDPLRRDRLVERGVQ